MDPGTNPDRHWYLHTPECNEKWREYLKCYEDHPILRTAWDICGNHYMSVTQCFKKERLAKRKLNHELADKNRANLVKKSVKEALESEAAAE